MVNKIELEKMLKYSITDKKYQEICNLEYIPLTRIRTDLTFTTWNHLFVLGRAPSEETSKCQKITRWWCICDCLEHSILMVRVNNLTSGNTKSCGCQKKESSKINLQKAYEKCKLDLTGQKFGKLIALYPTEKRIDKSVAWLCQCDCGNQVLKAAKELNNYRVFSCGCLKESQGSLKIKQILQNKNILFETEKTFDTCLLPSNQHARFDFYLIDKNILIEYDGEQHFKELDLNFFHDSLEKRQCNDKIKNQWCLNNNIPLYRVPYYDINKINTLSDILDNKYLVKEELI